MTDEPTETTPAPGTAGDSLGAAPTGNDGTLGADTAAGDAGGAVGETFSGASLDGVPPGDPDWGTDGGPTDPGADAPADVFGDDGDGQAKDADNTPSGADPLGTGGVDR